MDISTILGTFMSGANRLIRGIKVLGVPRIEDLPYATSPPIQFVYESTAHLVLGNYLWADPPSPLLALRPVRPNTLYFIRNVTLSADVEELDFTTNIVTAPQFYGYMQSDSRAVLFREPLIMVKFMQQFDFRYAFRTQQENDQLFAGFTGQLVQGAGLIGKVAITLKAIIAAQEIVDDGFNRLFFEKYPGGLHE
jgi:hypothetical protein